MAIEVSVGTGQTRTGFRSRAIVDESPATRRTVAAAVERAKEHDDDALGFLYARYADNVYGYVRSIMRDDHDAEDVTQLVFAKVMTALAGYQQRDVPFLGWLLRLARNAAIDQLRAARSTPTEEVHCTDDRGSDDVRERSRHLRDALAALPDAQRNVVVLRHVVGLTPGEIAEQMGRTESSIHGLHHRGRQTLQAELRREGAGPCISPVPAAA